MITCKEDMRGCYALRCDKEVFELFMNKCDEFGIKWAGRRDEPRDCQFGEAVVFSGTEEDKLTHGSELGMKKKGYKRLTPSDLKPRTKVEYEKVTDSIFDLKDEFESGVLYQKPKHATDHSRIIHIQTLAQSIADGFCYRKVERPVEWWEDAVEFLNGMAGLKAEADESGNLWISFEEGTVGAGLSRDTWCDLARIILEQEGE